MTRREKPLHEQMQTFCRWHLGKGCFAPFTGGDWPAWQAFCYLLRSYTNGGGVHAIAALKATLACAQHTEAVLRVFVQTIPGAIDWGDVARLWPTIADGVKFKGPRCDDREHDDVRRITAINRYEAYRNGSDKLEMFVEHHGWNPIEPTLYVVEGAHP